MKVTVKFMGIPRERTHAGRVEFLASKTKLKEVLKEIATAYPIGDVILTESGEVKPYARVLVNGRSFQFLGGLDTEIHDGDSIALIYPWIGHEDF